VTVQLVEGVEGLCVVEAAASGMPVPASGGIAGGTTGGVLEGGVKPASQSIFYAILKSMVN